MRHIKFFQDIRKTDVGLAGGKGASLGEMTSVGIPVPPGFVVLANAFDRFVEETYLKEEIEARLAEVDPADTNSVDKASNVLRDVIHDTAMPEDLKEEILGAFDELFSPTPPAFGHLPSGRGGHAPSHSQRGEFRVAVRSSATAEDGEVASWAGELDTFLNTTRDNVLEKVRECWSSLFTPRAIFYRHEKGLIDAYVSVAVVVQKMVQSEISGIAFTVHPVTEDPNQMIIEAGFGLGEAIVSGQITPDSYIITKDDMSIFDINIGHQTRKLIKKQTASGSLLEEGKGGVGQHTPDPPQEGSSERVDLPEGGNEWIDLDKEQGEKQKLTGKQIIELAEICKKIENHYGFPCDIEWAIENNEIYITQSRPITTLKT